MLTNQFDLKKPWRVVIYARMSDDTQNARSPDQQIATVNEFINRLHLPWVVVAVYRDDGISGRYTRKRPGFQQMLRDLKSGAVHADLVLVDTFERLSRAEEGADIRRQLRKSGVLVLTADSGFADPTTTSGKALAMVEAIRATEDGRVKAHNVLRGKKDAIRQGHWPGGAAPFGCRLRNVMAVKNGIEEIDHRKLEPNPETRWIIEEAFRLADEQGWGQTRIAKSLNADPRIPAALKPFHASTVGVWLDNPIYIGELVWGKNCTGIVDDVRILQPRPEAEWERYPGFCEPLVSREVWDRVQALRNERRRRRVQAIGNAEESKNGIPGLRAPGIVIRHLLTGLVRCARSMTPSSTKPYRTKTGEERRYVSYVCPGYLGGICPNERRIPEPWLRETVVNLILERLFVSE